LVSIIQVIGCEDHLRNVPDCVVWGVKLILVLKVRRYNCMHELMSYFATTATSDVWWTPKPRFAV